MFDLSGPAWHFGVSPLELVARSVLVYLMFLFALRVSGKRELGQFTIFDLAAVLLAANALQPAITGPDASIPGAVVILVTLFGMNHVVAVARRRFPFVRRLVDVPATVIARDGAWITEALATEDLDDDDLGQALRERGLDDIKDVKLAVLEGDGSITVVSKDRPEMRMRARVRRYKTRGGGGR